LLQRIIDYVLLFMVSLALLLSVQNCVELHRNIEYSWLEVKYVIFDPNNNSLFLEVTGMVWFNGAPDFNNRPFKFRIDETVNVTCPENLLGAKFSFWQLQEPEPTYQGLIVTTKTLTITLNKMKTIWWANYVGNLTSLGK